MNNDLLYIHVLPTFEPQHSTTEGGECVCEPSIGPSFTITDNHLEVRVVNHRPEGIDVLGVVHPGPGSRTVEEKDGSTRLIRDDTDMKED